MELVRPLGTFEHFRATLHDLGFHYNVALSAQYSSKDQALNRALVHKAVQAVLAKHAALNVTIREGKDGHPCFVRLPGVDLDEVVRFKPQASYREDRDAILDELLSEQNSAGFGFESSKPLWRILVVYQQIGSELDIPEDCSTADIMFVWHHVIGDGHSGLFVLDDILTTLNDPLPSTYISTSNSTLAPALETLLKMPPSLQSRVRRLSVSIFGDKSPTPEPRKWSGSEYQAEPPIRTVIQHIRVSPASLQALIRRCKAENVSMTAFMQSLCGAVLFSTFQDACRLRCATAISLRRFMPPENGINGKIMGMWVSAFHVDYLRQDQGGIGERYSWDAARKNKARIAHEIAKGDTDVETGALREIKDFKATMLAKLGHERQDSFAVTNLGEVASTKHASPWRLTDIVFSQSCHVNGSAVQFCIISTQNGDMVISLSSQEGVVPQEDLDSIAISLRKRLNKREF